MASQAVLVRVLSDFARTLVSNYAIGDVLYDLVERVTEVLDLAGAGVTLEADGRMTTATAFSERVARLERVQEEAQTGPCVEAHRTGQPVLVADIGDEAERWGEFVAAARDVGISAVAGIPMQLGPARLGALNLYAAGPRSWSEEDVAVAQVLADMATSYLASASALEQSRRTAEQLEEALRSRVLIEQAKGMLAAERNVSVDRAFELLRDHARNHNASLRSVADAVVRLGLRP